MQIKRRRRGGRRELWFWNVFSSVSISWRWMPWEADLSKGNFWFIWFDKASVCILPISNSLPRSILYFHDRSSINIISILLTLSRRYKYISCTKHDKQTYSDSISGIKFSPLPIGCSKITILIVWWIVCTNSMKHIN